MRPTDFIKILLVFLLNLLLFSSFGVNAQQQSQDTAPPSSSAGIPHSKSLPSAVPEKSTLPPASSSLPKEDIDAPSLPGVQTQVLEGDEKIPRRSSPSYEDWNKPELTPGMRTEVMPMGKSEHKGFSRELINVQWREMDPIDLWIIKPAGIKNPPVILYLYSYPSSNDRFQNLEFCEFLTKNGFAAVGFASALTGQRFHDRPKRESFVSQFQESLGTSVHDVQLVLNYLSSRGDLDTSRVGMWGDGSGASIAIMAAAVDSRIKTLDLLDPWGDWPEWLAKSNLVPEQQRDVYVSSKFLRTVENLDPLKALPKLKTQKIRLQYIQSGSMITPLASREHMEAAAPSNVQIVHYADMKTFIADIGSTGKGFDWIKKQVGSLPSMNGGDRNLETASQLKNESR